MQQNIAKETKQLEQVQKEYKKLVKQVATAEKKLEKIVAQRDKVISQNSSYKTELKVYKTIEKKLTAIAYDEKKHAQVQAKQQEVETKLSEYAKLQQELTLQKERSTQIALLQKNATQTKKQDAELAKKLKTYAPQQEKQKLLQKREQNIAAQQQTLRKEKEQLLQQKGAYENQQKKLRELELHQKTEQKKLKQLNEEIQDYQEIAAATSKNGIQALLIENAIPEVEQEANQLLSKLTNNQAQIFIESLRDLQKGGTKETLDIKISDTAGIRPYELFSGGEAFRIDFALRIAISKLLARRAGTALQTLIIDEGFGSQDQEGLAHIMDAIHKIQADFVKIIVVSHLTSMKDQFPVHFFVQKDTQGSRIDVMQLG